MSLMHSNAVIANAASESNVIDLSDRVIVALHMPDTWTAATVSLLAAETATGDFSPVWTSAGEVKWTIAQDQTLIVDPNVTRGLRYVKLRSGDTAVPVNQGAARTISCGTIEDSRS